MDPGSARFEFHPVRCWRNLASSLIAGICIFTFHVAGVAADKQWTTEKANAWYAKQPWPVGCNFGPSTAINQLEMWQADTFDRKTIDRELGWAKSIGFNTVRVYLHDLLWTDKAGFLSRMDEFLTLADRHGIRVMFVLLDGVWDPFPEPGRQRNPRPHVHNSGWLQSPGVEIIKNPARHHELKPYIYGVVHHFRDDKRILAWDIFNEPDNINRPAYVKHEPENKAELILPLLTNAYNWARAANPSQPITAGVWIGNWADPSRLSPMERFMLEASDIITFHSYDAIDDVRKCVENLRRYGRPILCTEYMARPRGSTFDPILAYFKEQKVGAYNWGFVSGKTQTIYPWDSWEKAYTAEPPVWFHDIFRADGSPYEPEEVDYIRAVTGKRKSHRQAPIRVLIVDGQQLVFHDWKATTPEIRSILRQAGIFDVNVATTPPEKAAPAAWDRFQPQFRECDVVLLNYHGEDWPAATLDALEEFVASGGGLVTFHAGGSSFENRESFNRMIGLAWRNRNAGPGLALDEAGVRVNIARGEGRDSGHGPSKPFVVRTRQPNHPVMNDMPAQWTHAADELWNSLRGPAERLEILATALSPETRRHEPMAWTVQFGKGRVWATALGHDVTALRCAGFRTLVARGCEWAATGSVTLPVADGILPADLAAESDVPAFDSPPPPNPLLTSKPGEARVVRINAGSGSDEAVARQTWQRDQVSRIGGLGYVGGNAFSNDTIEDPLVRTCRFGEFEYRFDTANGNYDVTLIMGEPFFQSAGQRVFSVEAEGATIIADLDLFKEAGFGKRYKKAFRTTVRDGQLNLRFSATVNEALVSAIQVKAID
jgi:type 1 glutamine amidotransferase